MHSNAQKANDCAYLTAHVDTCEQTSVEQSSQLNTLSQAI